MSTITRQVAEFVAGIEHAALPEEVSRRTRMFILDQIGIALRARAEAELAAPTARALGELGLAAGACTVFGDGERYAAPAAAFFNGNLGHCLDFDDTHARGSLHPSAPIVPAALAAAEMSGADGATVIAAVVAGYELQIRLSIALDPSAHYARGFHPTATCGVFGAAAAAARVFGLAPEAVVRALGLAGSQAAGSLQFLADGAWNKPFHVGLAAMNGLLGATLARAGFRGTGEPIEGRSGFLHGYAPEARPEAVVAGLGERWETLGIALKPYPSCRYSHAPIDALLELRAAHRLDWREVTAVEVGIARTGMPLIGEPEARKHDPRTYVDAQFSMPFLAALALREGRVGWDDYRRHLADPETLALCRRVRTVVDEQAEAAFPDKLAGVVRIETASGRLERFVRIAKGEPENFLSEEELRAKFDDLAAPSVEAARRATIAARVLALDEEPEVGTALALARAPGAARAAG